MIRALAIMQAVTWYFTVTAVSDNGAESNYSNSVLNVMEPGDSVTLTFTPPTTNTDGSSLTNLAGFKFYAGKTQGTYTTSVVAMDPSLTSFVWADVAGPLPLGNPTQEPRFTYTVAPTPPASITVSNVNSYSEFDLVLVGAVDFTLTAPSGQRFDYCMRNASDASTVTPTTPPIGTNNENVTAAAITIRGPVSTRCDLDTPPSFSGFTVRVGSVSKPLVQSGGTWSAAF